MNRSLFPARRGGINTSIIGVLLLVATVVISLAVVIRNVIAIEHPSKTALRICHWQLESGYREALDAVIVDYQKLHPGVEIIQMPVTEKLFTPWINTQLISGTAPDLVEMGHSNLSTKDEYTVRFFDPLGDAVAQPNPYNAGTALEGLPWKETFRDGMRGGFKANLQDYYMVPTTSYSGRLYCNVDLIREATGSDAVPTSYGEFIDVCKKVRAYSLRSGGQIIPVVSCYGAESLTYPYLVPFTAKFENAFDVDLDGSNSVIEAYRGWRTGLADSKTPAVRAYWEAMKTICDQMQKGFSSMDRQQAQFQFVNGNAAFMATGSWDARGTFLAAEKKGFKIKLIESPLPKPGEQYSEFIAGRANEAAALGGGAYGIYKNSKQKALALDFLRYLTSVAGNEKFNRLADWPPIVLGSEPSDEMKPFMPNPVGYTSKVTMQIGSRVTSTYNTELLRYLQGEQSLDQFFANYDKALNDPKRGGDWASWYEFDQRWRDCRNQERLLARDELEELMRPDDYSQQRYNRTLLQQIRKNNGCDYQYLFQQFRGKPLPMF